MNKYLSYGLRINSEIDLPELSRRDMGHTPDVTIRKQAVDIPDEARALPSYLDFAPDGTVRYSWPEVGAFKVSADGSEVLVEPSENVNDDLIAFPLLGPILSEVLRAKGRFVFHAGGIVIDGQAVGLLADKGVGKSTTTMKLVASGARLLTDDLFAISVDHGIAAPGFGQVKLVAEARAFAPEGSVERPFVHEKIDKARVVMPDFDAEGVFPATWLFVLKRGQDSQTHFSILSDEEALVSIMRFSFPVRFGDAGAAHGRGAVDFMRAAAISKKLRVAMLEVPNTIPALSGVKDAISRFLAEQSDVAAQ